jgi:uncharacterized membrane protein YkvA (DUF1232 family)
LTIDIKARAKEAEKYAKNLLDDPVSVESMAQKAQEKLRRNGVKLGDVKQGLGVLIRLLRAWSGGKYSGISISSLLIVAGTVFYFLNPFDAIPDFFPIIGFTDDISLIAFAISRLKGEFDKFEEWEQTVDVKTEINS